LREPKKKKKKKLGMLWIVRFGPQELEEGTRNRKAVGTKSKCNESFHCFLLPPIKNWQQKCLTRTSAPVLREPELGARKQIYEEHDLPGVFTAQPATNSSRDSGALNHGINSKVGTAASSRSSCLLPDPHSTSSGRSV
jgi:hypothetical protein